MDPYNQFRYILDATHIDQTASQHCLPPWGMKPTVLDQRNLSDLHMLTLAY
jgi:hypothetical protein